MANVLHRTTKQYLTSVNTPDYPTVDWIINPDVSAVAGFATKHWTITGDVVTLMTQAERDAVDAAELSGRLASERLAAKNSIPLLEAEGFKIRALIETLNKRDNYIILRLIELQNRVAAMCNSTGAVGNMRIDGLAVSISATSMRTRFDAMQAYRGEIDADNGE